jgi:TP901 family phage tail tape measure protein
VARSIRQIRAFGNGGVALANRLEVEIVGDSRSFEKALNRAGNATSGFGSKLASLSRLGAVAGVAAVAVGLERSVQAAVDFDREMRNVNSIAKLGDAQFKDLGKSVTGMAAEVGQKPKVLAAGLYDIVSSGFKASDAVKVLRVSAKAATAGLTDTATASKAVTAALNAYHLGADNARKVSDVLFQTVNKGVLTFDELSQQMGDLVPASAPLGISLEEVGAGMATLTLQGVSAAEAATRMKNAMISLAKPTPALTALLKKQGYESGVAAVKALGFSGTLALLSKATHGSVDAQAKLTPEIRTMLGVVGLTGKNLKTYNENLRAMTQAQQGAGVTAQVFAEQSKSVGVQWQKVSAALDVLKIQIGSALLPALSSILTWTSANMPAIQAGISGAFSAIGEAWTKYGKPAFDALIIVGGAVVAAVRAHWTEIRATIVRAVADIRGVIEGFIIIGKALWAQFGGALQSIAKSDFGAVVTVIRDVFRIIEGVFRLFSDLLHGNWSKAWGDLKQIAGAALNGVVTILKAAVGTALIAAKAIGMAILEGLGNALKQLGILVKNHWQAVIVFMLTLPSQLGSIAFSIGKSIVSGILSGLGDLASKVGGKIKDGVSGAVHFAGGLLHGSGEFMFTKQAIGEPLAKGVIEGWLEGTASLPSKISEKLSAAIERGRQLIDSKRSVFTTAFGRLTDRIFSAFDAATAQHQTPAEKLIAQITDRRQMEDLQKALEDAITGGDPQAILRAQEDIQMVSLQKQADEERQNYNARRDNLRQTLEDRLAMLQNHFTKEGSTVGELTKGITRLLASFGLDFANVGDLLGNAFLSGLKKAIATAGKGSSAIEKTIATVADTIRTTVPTGKAFAMASGGSGTVTKPTLFMAGEAGREDFAFSGGGKSFGGGGNVYNFSFPNYVGDKADLARVMRAEFQRVVKDNGSLGFAT